MSSWYTDEMLRIEHLSMGLLVALTSAPLGCTKSNPAFCDEDTVCADPDTPYCDLTGEFGNRNTCVANPLDASVSEFDAGAPVFDASPLPDGPVQLSVTLDGTGTGAVASSPSGIDCGSACDGEFAQGSQVTLSGSPQPGTTFVTWGGDCTRNFEDCILTMNADKAATATFGISSEHLRSIGHGTTGDDVAHDVAFDGDGNLAVAGSFTGTVDFGDGNPVAATNASDGFVALYDGSGALSWVVPFGGTGDDTMYSVAFDASGDVYAVGNLEEEPATPHPFLIVRLSATNGTEVWREELLGSGLTVASAVAVSATHVVSVGYFSGITDFGGGEVMGRATDGFVMWRTLGGDFVRVIRIQAVLPDLSFEFSNDVAMDAAGDVYVVGTTTGTTFDLGSGSLPPLGEIDFYVVKYSSAGAHQWSKRYGGAASESANSVAIDNDGNVHVTGTFIDDADFGDGTVTANTGAIGGQDAFVASYRGDTGAYRWAHNFGGTNGTNIGAAVAASPRGTVFASGTFDNSVDFGGGNLVAAGDTDIYLASYSQDTGTHVRSVSFGASDDDVNTSPDMVTGVAIDDIGRVAMVGFTANTLSFGGAPVASVGGTDFFVAVFGP